MVAKGLDLDVLHRGKAVIASAWRSAGESAWPGSAAGPQHVAGEPQFLDQAGRFLAE
jgi:hypothetical protein